MMGVGQGQADRFNDGPSNFNGEAAAMRWQHIHAEHDPHRCTEGTSTNHSPPDQAQLSDIVNGQPISEGLDQVHLANQEGHSGIGFCTPVVLPKTSETATANTDPTLRHNVPHVLH